MDLNNLINKIDIKQEKENKALDKYTENADKNREKLETLLSEFKEIISEKAAPELWKDGEVDEYYNYINKKINDFEFDVGNLPLYQINDIIKNSDENTKFGLFLSALINKNVKAGEKLQITALMPINFLFYRLENAEAYVNKAGRNLGSRAKNSRIYAEEAGNHAGWNMQGCELHVKKAGEELVDGAENSRIYVEEAGDSAGLYMENCELHVKKAKNFLGRWAKNSKIYADEVGEWAGLYMENCELNVRKAAECLGSGAKNSRIYAEEAGNQSGEFMAKSELHVKEAGDELGFGAKNSRIYAGKAGDSAGKHMLASKLSIYELKGKLDESCLTGNNEIYLGRESYEKFSEYQGKAKIWGKKALEQELNKVSRAVKYEVVGGTGYGSK